MGKDQGRTFFRARRSFAACARTIFPFSCVAQALIARSTASAISTLSSPMYSFEVPLKGIFVLTMLTKIPILSLFLSILYELQFSLCTHRVTTSLPASNNKGIRLANRKTL